MSHDNIYRVFLSNYKAMEIGFQIQMGNKSKCTLVGRGIVTFQRESDKNINVTDVLHVPGVVP